MPYNYDLSWAFKSEVLIWEKESRSIKAVFRLYLLNMTSFWYISVFSLTHTTKTGNDGGGWEKRWLQSFGLLLFSFSTSGRTLESGIINFLTCTLKWFTAGPIEVLHLLSLHSFSIPSLPLLSSFWVFNAIIPKSVTTQESKEALQMLGNHIDLDSAYNRYNLAIFITISWALKHKQFIYIYKIILKIVNYLIIFSSYRSIA